MELTYEEKLQLDNSIEHLRVVQSNLRIVNGELSMVLALVNAANSDLIKVTQDKERIQKENTKFLEDISEIKSSQDRREISLNEKENKIIEREKEVDKRVSQANNELDKINETARLSLSNYLKTIDAQNIILNDYRNSIELLKKEINENKETIEEQSRVKTKQENELIGLNNKIEEAQKELARFIIKSNLTQEATIKLIEDEKDKIKNPLELIKREQDKLDKLKDDISIIRLRLSQQFKRQNPDKILPIELQDK